MCFYTRSTLFFFEMTLCTPMCAHKKTAEHNNELKSQHTDFNVEHIPLFRSGISMHQKNFLFSPASGCILENSMCKCIHGIRHCDFHNLILNKPERVRAMKIAMCTRKKFSFVYFYELNENKSEITTDERQAARFRVKKVISPRGGITVKINL